MTAKLHWLAAATLLVALGATGCHHNTCGGSGPLLGGKLQGVGGACQKGACQKGCDGGYRGHKLLDALHGHFWGCSGCGEVYWNEWQYDPPDCCDPCDDCYGQFVGPRDCCGKKFIIDPVLWVLALKGKHCRQGGCYDPCGNWHCCCEGDCGGCGCSKGGGASYSSEIYEGEYLEGPQPEGFSPEGTLDDVPDPMPIGNVSTGPVATREQRSEARQVSHELRR